MSRVAVGMGVVATALALAPGASGATYCVGTPSCPGGTPISNFQSALNIAGVNTNADTIKLGSGTFSGPFNYLATGAVTVQGAGRERTVLTMPVGQPDFEQVLRLGDSGAAKRVSDLSVRLPVEAKVLGLNIQGAAGSSIERVSVTGPGTADQRTGLALGSVMNGAVRSSSSTMSLTDNPSEALGLTGGTTTVEDVALTGSNGVFASDGGATVRRARIRAGFFGFQAQGTGNVIESSTIDLVNGGTAIRLSPFLGNAALVARHVTIVARVPATGMHLFANSGLDGTLTVSHSIIRGTQTALVRSADGAGSVANVSSSYTSTGGAPNSSANTNGGTGSLSVFNSLPATPGFVNEAGGDLRLRHDSPLIDAGSGTTIFGAFPFDLDGLPRVVAGRRDAGAYEYQRRPPVARASVSPVAGPAGRAFGFSAAGSGDPDHGDTIAYAWSFDDGAKATGASPSHTFASEGRHTAKLTVTDPKGLTATATVVAADRHSPTIGRLRMKRKRFRVSRKGAGSGFLFTLSERANVRIAIERARPGRRIKRRGKRVCVKPRRRYRRNRRCTRHTSAGTLRRTLEGGRRRVAFTGRIGRKALKPGSYRASLRATDSSGNRSKLKRVKFRVLR